jgi:hypothetical protein
MLLFCWYICDGILVFVPCLTVIVVIFRPLNMILFLLFMKNGLDMLKFLIRLYQANLYFSPKFSGIMTMLYENSTMQLDYIEYAIGIR